MTNGQQDGDRKKKEEWKEGRVKRGGNRVKRRGKERNDIEVDGEDCGEEDY